MNELFPHEIRASTIAIFFAIGSGGQRPWTVALQSRDRDFSARSILFYGNLIGAGAMLIGSIVALRFGVYAEQQPLEHIAPPLSCRGSSGTVV